MKLVALLIIGLLAFTAPATAGLSINEVGKMTENAPLYKHHWDVSREFNFQCAAKKGDTVRAVNKITWLNGVKLVHLRYRNCNGWTYQSNFRKN